MQGGSRRSALYGSINWQHEDIWDFMKMKNWHDMPIQGAFKQDGSPFTISDAKMNDFNYKAPLDQMNISVNYDDAWLNNKDQPAFEFNVRQAMMTGEPGFSFNLPLSFLSADWFALSYLSKKSTKQDDKTVD